MKKSGLGRGLGSLIQRKNPPQQLNQSNQSQDLEVSPDETKDEATQKEFIGKGLMHVDINKIDANPYQPRESFKESDLSDLTASIMEHGILQPLIVTKKDDDSYELIAGERRLRASKLAGLKEVPVIVKEVDNFGKLQLAIIENIQRADLNSIEEAKSFEKLAKEFDMTHEEIARQVGKSRSFISNTLRLLNLPHEIKDAIADGKLNSSQSRSLVALEGDEQKKLFNRIVGGKMTTREVESEARKVSVQKHVRVIKKDPITAAKEEQIQRSLGTKVLIKKKGDGGQIIVDFYSDEELNSIIDKIA
jgi:ParB family transcriptional regulator, chromosome partitioning protein